MKVKKLDISNLKIGTEATFITAIEDGINTINRIEKSGYDSAWISDHIMGWTPESIWHPDIIKAASFNKYPHHFYEAFSILSVAGWATSKINIGTSVTEVFRRHPAVLAQTALTQDNISKGRFILGIGAGEGENVIPYGIEWKKPVSRLEEALKIIRLLWESNEKVSYDGSFWKLKDAILQVNPYEKDTFPPIWVAAHGPRMLDITGKLADGWFPAYSTPTQYNEKLKIIKSSAKNVDRDPNSITPALFSYVIIDDDHGECEDILRTPMIKNQLLQLPNSVFEQYNTTHPFGEDFYGLLEYIPTKYDKETILSAIDEIPDEMCKDIYLHGTVDEIIEKIEEYAKAGLKHMVLCNHTYLADPLKIRSSFKCMKRVLEYFKDT
ncbi:MAG: LLM class flavin-dependent oxidoreductase [Promethearchaeota archaeon]|nr:MAG: LLM class flavin-dependent oxidoreductase [Candidatus Lokiarchaeota archaeon]